MNSPSPPRTLKLSLAVNVTSYFFLYITYEIFTISMYIMFYVPRNDNTSLNLLPCSTSKSQGRKWCLKPFFPLLKPSHCIKTCQNARPDPYPSCSCLLLPAIDHLFLLFASLHSGFQEFLIIQIWSHVPFLNYQFPIHSSGHSRSAFIASSTAYCLTV